MCGRLPLAVTIDLASAICPVRQRMRTIQSMSWPLASFDVIDDVSVAQ
jgi:hypothetical protein